MPFQLTRDLSYRITRSEDQYDTAKVLLGILFFLLFWSAQTFFVYYYFSIPWALTYLASLIISTPFALKMRKEYHIILDNVKIFFLFMRKKQLRQYLETKRKEIEVELARLLRIVKRLPKIQ